MNRHRLPLLILALTLPLAACEPTAPPQPEPNPAPQPTVLDDQFRAIDRAKAVEDEVLKQKEAQDKEIEAQGG